MTDDIAKDPSTATFADWLDLHGITAEALAAWIPDDRPAPRPPDPPLAVAATPEEVTAALALSLPSLGALLKRVCTDVLFDLAPDLQQFPRAFTIDDLGDGRPFVSCPCRGRTSDLLRLAHEIGHALQAMAGPAAHLHPIQREMGAFIAEDAATHALWAAHRALGPLLTARQAKVVRHAPSLRAAFHEPSTPYSYAWNYPAARSLASRAIAVLATDDVAALCVNPGPLGPLMARLA
jgi:hypothetical protein